jgi:signal transduction histidine kinase/ActR/RegA family two-component response regulator
MSVDPQTIRAEAHVEIGRLLRQNVTAIIERWTQRAVQEQPGADRVHHAVLLDHLHEYLLALGDSLADVDGSKDTPHRASAFAHGEQRWDAGWSLPEVVRDYQILRLVIFDFLEEAVDRPLALREVLAVGLALDEAISASVVSFIQQRDEHFREQEQHRAEQDRAVRQQLHEQAESLREADHRKNQFLAILGHELRNPLASISTSVQILDFVQPADPDLISARDVIHRQVEQMTSMVDDLLDVSRIAQGKLQLHRERVEVRSVVDRAVEMARPLIDAREHTLRVTQSTEDAWIDVDRARFSQVLANLLTNAAKYTARQGAIELAVAREGNDVVVRVHDNGMGIAPDLLPRIFDPFTQDARTMEHAQGGLGIGLALVRSLIDLHGGSVRASSPGVGQGSEFVVRLPVCGAGPAQGQQDDSGGRTRHVSRSILVVDDDQDTARTLSLLLKLMGHVVRTAFDGPGALEAAVESPPEFVLLDIGLPGMNGLEVARRMRDDPALSAARLVALTGYGQEADFQRSRQAGFDDHLVKPVDQARLRELLDGDGAPPPAPPAGNAPLATAPSAGPAQAISPRSMTSN